MKTLIQMSPELKASFTEYMLKEVENFNFTHRNNFEVKIDKFIDEYTKDIPEPLIAITPLALLKMQALVAAYDKELAWHGVVAKIDDVYTIQDILVYPQIATAATVDANEDEYGKWLMKNRDVLNNIRMQGHSHVNMGVSPSGTDLTYYKDLLVHVDDFYIFLIVNKAGLVHVRFYDMTQNILFTDVPIQLALESGITNLKEWAKSQTDAHIQNFKPKVPAVVQTAIQQTFFDPTSRTTDLEEEEYYEKHGYPYNQVYRGN